MAGPAAAPGPGSGEGGIGRLLGVLVEQPAASADDDSREPGIGHGVGADVDRDRDDQAGAAQTRAGPLRDNKDHQSYTL